ncbi:hypothetical protein ACS0TY_026952 [Phlomoides rotata]
MFSIMEMHRNILTLRGFCMTSEERFLVYPCMVNGCVDSCLRERPQNVPPLDWGTRKRIALGSARGLTYLHDHCDPQIIHRDVKAANILLDEEYEAVVGDFSLAKLMDNNDTHVTTAVRGTIGHIAPEYLSTGKISEKTDVFAYGVTLLELITGQRAFDLSRLANDDDVMLLDWVKGIFKEKKLERLVDPNLQNNFVGEEVEQLIQVALLCTQTSSLGRPKMWEVVRLLEGDGLAEKWDEWQKVEEERMQVHDFRFHPSFDWIITDDSIEDLDAVELSGLISSYFLVVDRFSKCGKNLQSASSGTTTWKKMWALKIPPEISHFLRRACNESLPSLYVLNETCLITTPTDCPSCGLEPETTSHVLLRCPIAIHTWGRSSLKLDYDALHLNEFPHLFWKVYQNLPMHGVILFVTVAWSLWKARNKKWFEQEEQSPARIWSHSYSMAIDILGSHPVSKVRPKPRGQGGQWAPPSNPSLKLNEDAGVFPNNSVGLGFVVHDWKGQPILAGAQRCSASTQNSTLIEALTLRFGVSKAASKGLRITALETDSQSLALALQGRKEVYASSAMIVANILGAGGS